MNTIASEHLDLRRVDAILEGRKAEKGAIIPILQEVQEAYGYLPREALARIADSIGVPFSRVYGVATFYSQFYLTRRGKNVIKVCDGTACHVRGATHNINTLRHHLGVEPGQTTEDYQFTYEVVYCLGACALGPVAVVNGQVKGKCTAERMHRIVEELRA
ncbi:MAG: NADH-quinone oxidoreductase subunit NuoE [Sphingomonadaceae bacterium]